MTALRDRLTDLLQRANPWPRCRLHPDAPLGDVETDPIARKQLVRCGHPGCSWSEIQPMVVIGRRVRP